MGGFFEGGRMDRYPGLIRSDIQVGWDGLLVGFEVRDGGVYEGLEFGAGLLFFFFYPRYKPPM